MIVLFVWSNAARIKLNKLTNVLEDIAKAAQTTTGEIKEYIERTIYTIEKLKNSLITVEFIRRATTEVISIINQKRGKK